VDQEGADHLCFHVSARCHHSYRKNQPPHELSCDIVVMKDSSSACSCSCTCVIGISGVCGHVIGLLFQLAQYTTLQLRSIPDEVPSTSLPQQWHRPRGKKIAPARTEDIQLAASAVGVQKSRPLSSTLYDPIASCSIKPDFGVLKASLQDISCGCQWLKISGESTIVSTKFGEVENGSILSYQQTLDDGFNLPYPTVVFPELPVANFMSPLTCTISDKQQSRIHELTVSVEQCVAFEAQTRQQSESVDWHSLREGRLTASNMGLICKRIKGYETLRDQLRRKVRATAAMKQGLQREPEAATAYTVIMDNEVNLYPCGVIISPFKPWIAATPDRKVYNPSREPKFGLLEIKCAMKNSIAEVDCLQADSGGMYSLKKRHNHYYQVMCQLAVAGLCWCDFFVFTLSGESHTETITFDSSFWAEAQTRIDSFFLKYYID